RHSHVKDRELFMEMAVRLENSVAPGRQSVAPNTDRAQPEQLAFVPAAQNAIFVPQPNAQPSVSTATPELQHRPDKNDFQILIPSFVTSQLKEGFEVGFLLFVPFIVVDMVIANMLLAMGMQMLSPTVISLPFKLLLFVLVDGWFLIIRGLVLSYT